MENAGEKLKREDLQEGELIDLVLKGGVINWIARTGNHHFEFAEEGHQGPLTPTRISGNYVPTQQRFAWDKNHYIGISFGAPKEFCLKTIRISYKTIKSYTLPDRQQPQS